MKTLLQLLAGLMLAGAGTAVAAQRPNLVLFIADDLGIDFVGCYGNKSIQTPNLDAVAREGIRFERMFAASPTCSPSRAAMFTGLYPQRNGTMGNHTDCRPEIKALPAYLKALGYRVVAAHKTDVRPRKVFDWELLPAGLPNNPALNRRYRGEGLDTAKVDKFLEEHARNRSGQPLCLLIGDNCPHVVWEKNKTYNPAALPMPSYIIDTPKTRQALANYYQDISTLDRHVGELLSALKKHGFETNTLLVITSDQGPEWPHCKWTCYDTGLRVPFIARWPGVVPAGRSTAALCSLLDLAPTFLEAAGGQSPADMDGRSFKEVLLGKSEAHRTEIFATHTGDGTMNMFPQRCVRDVRYKLILNLDPDRKWTTHFTQVGGIPDSHKEIWDSWLEQAQTNPDAKRLINLFEHHPAEELYDTAADPCELTNLVAQPDLKPILERLRSKLQQWREIVGETSNPAGD